MEILRLFCPLWQQIVALCDLAMMFIRGTTVIPLMGYRSTAFFGVCLDFSITAVFIALFRGESYQGRIKDCGLSNDVLVHALSWVSGSFSTSLTGKTGGMEVFRFRYAQLHSSDLYSALKLEPQAATTRLPAIGENNHNFMDKLFPYEFFFLFESSCFVGFLCCRYDARLLSIPRRSHGGRHDAGAFGNLAVSRRGAVPAENQQYR